MNKKEYIIEKLLHLAILHGIGNKGGVGYHIKKLNEEDRKIVKELKSCDFNRRIK